MRYRRLLIVDRDPGCQFAGEVGRGRRPGSWCCPEWGDFFDGYLGRARPVDRRATRCDRSLPAHAAPHVRVAGPARSRALARPPDRDARPCRWGRAPPTTSWRPTAPATSPSPTGLCPTHCIEPAICPVIRAPRTWEMARPSSGSTRHAGQARPRPPARSSSSASTGCLGSECSTSRRCWRAMRVVAEAGRAHPSVDVLVGTVSAVTGRPACCISVNSLRYGGCGDAGTLVRSIFVQMETALHSASGRHEPQRRVRCHHRRSRAGRALRRDVCRAGHAEAVAAGARGSRAASCSTPSGSTTIPDSSTCSAASWPT